MIIDQNEAMTLKGGPNSISMLMWSRLRGRSPQRLASPVPSPSRDHDPSAVNSPTAFASSLRSAFRASGGSPWASTDTLKIRGVP